MAWKMILHMDTLNKVHVLKITVIHSWQFITYPRRGEKTILNLQVKTI